MKAFAFVKKAWLLALVLLLTLLTVCTVYANEIAMVRAMGNVSTKVGNAQKMAIEDAKRKAVKKAVEKVVSQSGNGVSIGQQLVNQYQQYVAGNPKIVNKQKLNGKLVVSCDVPVDYTKIFAAVKSTVKKEQNARLNETVVFFVRLNGSGDKLQDANFADDAFGKYNAAFRGYGFQVEEIEIDEYNNPNVSFENLKEKIFTFMNSTKNYAKYAVISDIKVNKKQHNADVCFAEVSIFSEAYVRNGGNFVRIGQFNDTYSGTQNTLRGALDYAIQRASINSSKYLADLAYGNWKSSNR